MLGSRHQGYAWNRSVLSLLSVLALLAFACLPVAANADSSGVEYGNETPSAYGSHKSTPTVVGGGEEGGKAHSSSEGGGAGGGSGSGGSGSGGSSGGNAGTGSGNGAGGVEGGNGSSNPQHANGGGEAEGEVGLQQVASPTESKSDSGGSSPVVPILIALALLAAISAGIVIMRQRRQSDPNPDSPAAPKAG